MDASQSRQSVRDADYMEASNTEALLAPITVQEARTVHNRIMSHIFATKYVQVHKTYIFPSDTNFNPMRPL
jgi:hypothetical protein